MSILYEFLQRNEIEKVKSLPLVHTTRAHHLRSILNGQKIVATPCDVFKGENLNYFFVGRPAYKFPLGDQAELWELPVCFILDYKTSFKPKRMFPFDSGGFSRNLMPSHMTRHNLDDFEVSADPEAPEKIIGTFFGSAHNYFKFSPKRGLDALAKHDVSLLDSEIHSLHKLSVSRSEGFDDRHFSIEVQSSNDLKLQSNILLAAVVPAPYLDDPDFLNVASSMWDCDLLGYDIYPLRPDVYYHGVYTLVESVLRDKGFF